MCEIMSVLYILKVGDLLILGFYTLLFHSNFRITSPFKDWIWHLGKCEYLTNFKDRLNANKQLKSCWISGHRRFFPLLWHWIHINSWVGMTTIVQPLLDILNTWIIRSSNCDVTIKLDTVDGIITKLLHIWQPFWGAFPFIWTCVQFQTNHRIYMLVEIGRGTVYFYVLVRGWVNDICIMYCQGGDG